MKRQWIVGGLLCVFLVVLVVPWLSWLGGLRVRVRTETQIQHDPQELCFAIRANLSDDVILGILDKKPYLLDMPASNGFTPLCSAVVAQRNSIVAELLLRGANPNVHVDGETPLMIAIGRSNNETVSLLLAHGADPRLATSDGETPLARAERLQRWRIANILREALK